MKKRSNKLNFLLLTMILVGSTLLSSCIENSPRTRTTKSGSGISNGTGSGGSGGSGSSGSLPNENGIGDGSTGTQYSQVVELSHFVDPFDGTYKKKVTIPKNFKGNLYLAGLNVASLQDKLVKVRINMGYDGQSMVFGATVARASGITPQTDVQVLVLDLNSSPLTNLRLNYDLYDYNDYSTGAEPIQDPRDGGLYCRGLKLEHDPTYSGTTAGTMSCSASGDKCLYAYANVKDATLYTDVGLTAIPSRVQVWSSVAGNRNPTISSSLQTMCLPDSNDVFTFNEVFNTNLLGLNYNDSVLGYRYRGPYRAIAGSSWGIQGSAIFNNRYGLFESGFSPLDSYTGFRSFLFPRSGRLDLNQGIHFLGSSNYFGARALDTVIDPLGSTTYMDGCNLRALNYNAGTNEGIGSCNINASIEVFYMKDGAEVSITKDNTLKLQVIRPSLTNYEGKEVLISAFKRCENSSTCGSGECCYNDRCWSKDLVSQCVDQIDIIGNEEIGASCSSDFECSSLCCNRSTGTCSPHEPNGTTPILCNKNAGQQCVSKEFCKPEYVPTCKIVKTGIVNGKQTCALQCPPVLTYGDCKAGVCVPPVTPTPPTFDPNNCSEAVDP